MSFSADKIEKELSSYQFRFGELNNDMRFKQVGREVDILKRRITCNQKKLDRVNPEKLVKLVQQHFTNAKVMEAMACVVNSIFSLPGKLPGSIELNNRINNYLKRLEYYNNEGVNGAIFSVDLFNVPDLLLIKSGKREDMNYDINHEMMVGLYGTNQLRKEIPNFAYLYGGFYCFDVKTDKTTGKLILCPNDDDNSPMKRFIIYENITNSKSLEDFIHTCTFEEFLNVFQQIIYSLEVAHERCDFTHYDLHTRNVLIKPIPPTKVEYKTKTGKFTLLIENLAVIIDFGSSFIKYQNKGYGMDGYLKYGVFSYQSNILHDVYKIITRCAASSENQNKDIFSFLEKLYAFFDNKNPLTKELETAEENYCSLPLPGDLKISDFVRLFTSELTFFCNRNKEVYNEEFEFSPESIYNPII